MIFPDKYKCLGLNDFQKNSFRIVPIRYNDRFDIMQWRNEQIFHLRQDKELTVEDPFITVAGNNTGNLSTADFQEQGLVAKTSSATFAGLRFNNASLEWEISPNVDADGGPLTAYQAIGTSAAGSPGQPLNSVQFNSANTFGGSSNLTFDSSTQSLALQGDIVLGNIGSSPSSVANSAVLYHKQSSGVGGSGVYVSTSSKDVELIDKQAALVYSIIF